MKQLELELQERLHIVEYPEHIVEDGLLEYASLCLRFQKTQNELDRLIGDKPGNDYEIVCKGNELTEEVAKGLVDNALDSFYVCWFKDYEVLDTSIHDDYTFLTAIESFISSVKSKGFYWGENPIAEPKKPPFLDPNKKGHCENDYVDYRYDLHQFNEAESRTFNPSRTLIFKIS